MRIICVIGILSIFYFAAGEIDFENVEIPNIDIDAVTAIKENCDRFGGTDAYKNLKTSKDALEACLKNFANITVLANEVEESKKTGSMDEVFGKYCKKRPKLEACINNFTDNLQACLSSEEKHALNITLNTLKQLSDFICFRDGDRIAMFIAEGGVECIKQHTEGIQNCANSTLKMNSDLNQNSLRNFLLDKQKCNELGQLQNCVVETLEKCKESTPANIVDALFRFIKRSACPNKHKRSACPREIVKRSIANAANNFYNTAEIKNKFSNIIENKCFQNAPNGGYAAILESLKSIQGCSIYEDDDRNIMEKNVQNCSKEIISRIQDCLPEEEKYLPEFIYKVYSNLKQVFKKNKQKILSGTPRELVLCMQSFRLKKSQNEVLQCFNFSDSSSLEKDTVCRKLEEAKDCVFEQLKEKCIRDISINRLVDDFFEAATRPCKT